MGRRGPCKRPTAIRILEGNRSKRRLPENEPASTPITDFSAPADLSDRERAIWSQYAQPLYERRLLNTENFHAFRALCIHTAAFEKYAEALRELEKSGSAKADLFESPNGYPVIHPWVTAKNKESALMRQYFQEFGMTPSSRAGISVAPPDEDSVEELNFRLMLLSSRENRAKVRAANARRVNDDDENGTD
ncbi:MAG: P27 family phage terminase small subunit [Candidatus Hydrogenedentes bacterium]|nr:P27 family phage terminase small subunit [Candidatus Hydrogenedentota bacterium]